VEKISAQFQDAQQLFTIERGYDGEEASRHMLMILQKSDDDDESGTNEERLRLALSMSLEVDDDDETMLRAKEKERRSSIVYLSKERENGRLIYREKTILGFAEYHNRSPKPSTSAGARPSLGMGAGSHRGYKPPASYPQPLADEGCKPPNATEATRPNLVPTNRRKNISTCFSDVDRNRQR